MSGLSWAEDDERFRKELEVGHYWEGQVAAMFEAWGHPVTFEKTFRFRDSIDDNWQYRDQRDLIVYGYIIEVKSRKFRFTSMADYPYDPPIVENCRKFDAKDPADLYVNVSQFAHELRRQGAPTCLVALPIRRSRRFWKTTDFTDDFRGHTMPYYTCAKKHWEDEAWLREALEKASKRPRPASRSAS